MDTDRNCRIAMTYEESTWNAKSSGLLRLTENIEHIPIIRTLAANLAGIRLRYLTERLGSLEELVDLAFHFHSFGTGIMPAQVPEELIGFGRVVQQMNPRVTMEIGTAGGGSLFVLSTLSHPTASIISVDLVGGKFGGGYPRHRIPLYESFVSENQRIHLIRGDSHEFSTRSEVESILREREIDVLFIDGDHTYEGVRKDFEIYSPLVRNGGIVAFHDICPHPPHVGCEVNRFWNEIKKRYRHEEVVSDWNQGWAGIGIIFQNGDRE